MKRIELPRLDVVKYVGTESEIVISEIRQAKFGAVLFLETAMIPLKKGDSLPEGKHLTASVMLGLTTDEKTGELCVGIDTKTDKFFKNKGVNPESLPSDLKIGDEVTVFVGKKVICQKNQSGFLEIA